VVKETEEDNTTARAMRRIVREETVTYRTAPDSWRPSDTRVRKIGLDLF